MIFSVLLFALLQASATLASSSFADIACGGQAELLCSKRCLESYFEEPRTEADRKLIALAQACRKSYLTTGIAHVPNFVRKEVVKQMVQEAYQLQQQGDCFYSTEAHNVYQEPHDPNYPASHPRNLLQRSSKFIMDYDRIPKETSPLRVLYSSPELKAFVSYVVRPPKYYYAELYASGCPYNAAYYNLYGSGDGLGWHFDRSEFGVNLELQPAQEGGVFELCWNTRSGRDDRWCFEKVQSILEGSTEMECPTAQRISNPPVGPGSLVFFSGSRNLHRVTPVGSGSARPRINAIMTYETQPNQKPNAYSLRKFFGR